MNTTEKGNKLEDFVFEYLQNHVMSQYSNSTFSKVVVRKHKSYQKESNDSFIADVSIDCYLKNSDLTGDIDKPTFSFIFECKNYKNKVDKSDLDEFQNKIEHTRFTKVKGFLVTTSGFSTPIISGAGYYGIGLIVVNLDEQKYDIIVSRKLNSIDNEEQLYSFLSGNELSDRIVVFDNYHFFKFRSILENQGVYLKDEFLSVKYLKNVEIEAKAQKLIDEVGINELDSNLVIDKLLSHLGIKVEQKRLEEEQLGMLNINNNLISLSINLTSNRRNFTIAHEIGHFILHSEIFKDILEEYGETAASITLDSNIENYIERQANHFASWLLLTDRKLQRGFDLFCAQENIRKGFIYVDSQPDNYRRYRKMQDYMRNLYNVSWQVIEIRLKQKGWLRFEKNFIASSIADILSENTY